ncbi:MAG: S-layer homology domain-containing protein [bacterium]|nr:S-layer homology domain-containing protein [bacterium]MDQ3159067.1 S-layer homology domain-containing protein [bacterium]
MSKKQQNQNVEEMSPKAARKVMGDEQGAVATSSTSNKFSQDNMASGKFKFFLVALAFAIIGVGFVVASFASTGKYYNPKIATSRQAMAAFLYRDAGSPAVADSKCGNNIQEGPFKDVRPNDQFCKEIEWVSSTGISRGFSDGTFRPTTAVTRDIAVILLRRADDSPTAPECTADNAPFDDVTKDTPFCQDILYAKTKGYVSGKDGKFNPKAVATRQAVAVMFYNRAGQPQISGQESQFDDITREHPFFLQIQWMGEAGISFGFSGPASSTGNPDSTVPTTLLEEIESIGSNSSGTGNEVPVTNIKVPEESQKRIPSKR